MLYSLFASKVPQCNNDAETNATTSGLTIKIKKHSFSRNIKSNTSMSDNTTENLRVNDVRKLASLSLR